MKYLLCKCEIFADANVGKFHFTFCVSRKFHNSRSELFHRERKRTISLKIRRFSVKNFCFTVDDNVRFLKYKTSLYSLLYPCGIHSPPFSFLLYHKISIFSSEIFGLRRMRNNFLAEIVKYCSLWSQCKMKFAHVRVSEHFTFAKQIFHSEAISLGEAKFHSPKANFVEKSTAFAQCH